MLHGEFRHMKGNNKSKMPWIFYVRQGGISPEVRRQRPEIRKGIPQSDISGF